MTNNGIVNIHGKEYMTVARRVAIGHAEGAIEDIETEVLSHHPVVIRAKVTIKGHIFTGISSVTSDSTKVIEKQNPYEVAETSAVGRALGFAGFGLIESIASADEVSRSHLSQQLTLEKSAQDKDESSSEKVMCEVCGSLATEKKGVTKNGKSYHGIFCSSNDKSHTRWLWN
jgi:hypothetical protein